LSLGLMEVSCVVLSLDGLELSCKVLSLGLMEVSCVVLSLDGLELSCKVLSLGLMEVSCVVLSEDDLDVGCMVSVSDRNHKGRGFGYQGERDGSIVAL